MSRCAWRSCDEPAVAQCDESYLELVREFRLCSQHLDLALHREPLVLDDARVEVYVEPESDW